MFELETTRNGSKVVWFNVYDDAEHFVACHAVLTPRDDMEAHDLIMSFEYVNDGEFVSSWRIEGTNATDFHSLVNLALLTIEESWRNTGMNRDCTLEDDTTWEQFSYDELRRMLRY